VLELTGSDVFEMGVWVLFVVDGRLWFETFDGVKTVVLELTGNDVFEMGTRVLFAIDGRL
jgi:hypothetical protein